MVIIINFDYLILFEAVDESIEGEIKGLATTSVGSNGMVEIPSENDEENHISVEHHHRPKIRVTVVESSSERKYCLNILCEKRHVIFLHIFDPSPLRKTEVKARILSNICKYLGVAERRIEAKEYFEEVDHSSCIFSKQKSEQHVI
jgi:hypothetical protein